MGNWAKQARAALGERDYIQAGDFYKLDGDYSAAVKAYIKGDNYTEAARIYEDIGKPKKAEKLLHKHGKPGDLAEFYVRNDNPDRAVEIYMDHSMFYEAAELCERRNHLHQAATLYERLNFFEKAGILYGKTKHFDKAIEMFSRVIKQLEDSGNSNTLGKIMKYNDWIANLHIGAKRYNKAGQVFESIHKKEKAVKCFLKGGAYLEAGRLLMDLRRMEDAKKALQAEDSRESRIMLGKIAMGEKNYEKAVALLKDTDCFAEQGEAYENLGQFKRAAYFLEKAGSLEKAASMYARAHDYHRAAILFEQNGFFEDAARNYERQKKFNNAAKLYYRARNRYKAGYCLYRLKKYEYALKQFQAMESDDPNFIQGKTIMAEIFFKQGVYSVSRKLLEELATNMTLSEESMAIFYRLARCLEEEGDAQGAASYYERIMARRFDYGDVGARLKRLKVGRNNSHSTLDPVKKAPTDVTIGDVIADRFKITETIGKGGMGYIFKVRDLSLDRDIALKMLMHQKANFEELKGELLIARDLTHPYIIKVFDVGQWMHIGYFTMELVEGQPLKSYILKNEDTLEDKIELLIKICAGLKAAHDQHVVHRDIKPQNILVDPHKNPKILDFGIARKVPAGSKNGAISGSPKYMAPEQIQNLHTDLRTDVYALGIIMFYMFTKKEPFLAKTPQEVMLMHLQKPLPDPFEVNPKLPFWLSDIIKKCCQKNPELRFNDMGELIDELKLNLVDI